ncbi:MAG: hypothetical protein ACTHJU_08120, partial [Sphingopyxis sp.]
ASARALPLGVAACAAFAAQAVGVSFGAAAIVAAAVFIAADTAVIAGGHRLRGSVASLAWAVLVLAPAALAGWSVGALAAAWVGLDSAWPGLVTAFTACLIAGRRWTVQPI